MGFENNFNGIHFHHVFIKTGVSINDWSLGYSERDTSSVFCAVLLPTNGTVKMSHQKIDDITCKGNFRLTFCLFCLLKRELDMTAAHSETQKMDNSIIIKFSFSEKAKKIRKNSPTLFDATE